MREAGHHWRVIAVVAPIGLGFESEAVIEGQGLGGEQVVHLVPVVPLRLHVSACFAQPARAILDGLLSAPRGLETSSEPSASNRANTASERARAGPAGICVDTFRSPPRTMYSL